MIRSIFLSDMDKYSSLICFLFICILNISYAQRQGQISNGNVISPAKELANPCRNYRSLGKHAMKCILNQYGSVIFAQDQDNFCRAVLRVGDCMSDGVFNETGIRCEDADKLAIVSQYQGTVDRYMKAFGLQHDIGICIQQLRQRMRGALARNSSSSGVRHP